MDWNFDHQCNISFGCTVSGNIQVLTAGSCGTTGISTKAISVNALPSVMATTSASNICIGESSTLSGSGALNYVWNNAATTSSIIVSPSTNTNYTVTGTDANGCQNSATVTQNVSECTSISEHQIVKHLTVQPNPNNGVFTLISDVDAELNIVNQLGQVVKNITIAKKIEQKIVTADLPSGVYFVVGQSTNYPISQKIIVSK